MTKFSERTGPIRLGMVGGGQGAMIGAVHRIAARLDGAYTLVAGALSSTEDKARASAAEIGLAEDRTYTDFTEMAKREARRALEEAGIPVGWCERSQSGRALFLGVDARDSVGALRCVHQALLAPTATNDGSA